MVIRVAQKFVYYFPHPVVIAKCYDDQDRKSVV